MRLKHALTAAAMTGALAIVAMPAALAGDDDDKKRRYSPPPPYQGPTGSTTTPGFAEQRGYVFAPATAQPPQLLVPQPTRSKDD